MAAPDWSTAFASCQWYCVSIVVASAAGAVAVVAGRGAAVLEEGAATSLAGAPAARAAVELMLVPSGACEHAASVNTSRAARAVFMASPWVRPTGTPSVAQ